MVRVSALSRNACAQRRTIKRLRYVASYPGLLPPKNHLRIINTYEHARVEEGEGLGTRLCAMHVQITLVRINVRGAIDATEGIFPDLSSLLIAPRPDVT